MKTVYRTALIISLVLLAFYAWFDQSPIQKPIDWIIRLADGNFQSNMVLGIASGLVATAITIFIRSVWLGMVKPAIEELVYRDAHIEGKWFAAYARPHFSDNRYILKISRRGHKIEGYMNCTEGPDRGHDYTISGTFKNLILSATYETDQKCCLDRGALALALRSNGDRMEGHIVFYSDREHHVNSQALHVFRNKADFDAFLKEIAEMEESINERRKRQEEFEKEMRERIEKAMKEKTDSKEKKEKNVTPSSESAPGSETTGTANKPE